MAIPSDIDARRYFRVAYQRYEDGRLLLEINRPRAAIYIAGYSAECILKALLIMSTPPRQRRRLLSTFRGGIAHNIEWLRSLLAPRIGGIPASVARHLSLLSSWSTDLRYDPGPGDQEDAEEFLQAAEALLAWADGRM